MRGEDPELYRIGRRTDDPQRGLERTITLLGGRDADLRVDLVHLDVREAGAPAGRDRGTGIVAVAGLVNVQVAGRTPAVRFGEVLVADSDASRAGATSAPPRPCCSGSSRRPVGRPGVRVPEREDLAD